LALINTHIEAEGGPEKRVESVMHDPGRRSRASKQKERMGSA
jgi:hypothetical protein